MVKSRNNDDNEEDDGEKIISNKCDNNTATVVELSSVNRFYGWPASRIVRVSRATGGKDRHSKVLTSKGLRDRRVRLSVNTAIQFYDLQDRLGYDQPSKAVEWLLKAAATSIDELPPISTLFPDTPKQLSYEKISSCTQLGFDDNVNAGGARAGEDPNVPKSSACSSNSEENNSKGSSGLSLSRSENRVKARGRAKERLAAEKEKEHESSPLNPISQATSFTDLLNSTTSTNGGYWSSTPMDYFNSGLSRPAQMYLAVNPPLSPLFSVSGDQHQHYHHHHQHQHELQHFSFVPDQVLTSTTNNNNGSSSQYNLNFTISNNSSGLAGYNRGTLQSNSSSSLSSSSILPHLQRFSTPMVDGSTPGFFIGTALQHVENQHQFLSYGGDGQGNNSGRHSGGNLGGKLGKN